MRSLRILMISALEVWALTGGGGAPSLFKTLEAYSRRGHRIDFVTARVGANHHHGVPDQEPPAIEGVTYHRFQLPSLAESRLHLPAPALKADQKLRFALLFPYLAARQAERLLRTGPGFDLLYGYEVHGVLAQRRLRRRHALPLVARFQGTVMHPYLDRPLSLARKAEEMLALKTPADLYVMTDDGTRGDEVLQRLNPASAGKVRFWRNGLDLDHLRPPSTQEAAQARVDLGVAPGELVLVTTARLARWKRIDRAIDALALLNAQGVPARLFIVGDGEERDGLEAQARARGVADRLSFVGAVPQAEVQRYLWVADVFLSLSELSNVGNPLLEAMATGRCILTLDEGDTGDLIQDGVTGLLLPSGDATLIARSLAELAADPARRTLLGEAALAFAQQHFWSWQQRLDAELDAVEALVEQATAAVRVDV
jgi:glycosyltransferase involved in cell wall biosynthesis